ncbi:UBX domain-containing protein 10 [Diatrype stigma]|uniref:UBX domain-containing protein 10 n=1 Tax=Diatrype stigma TaxID=117547 RepID=A0AAN9UWL7_9PEZI
MANDTNLDISQLSADQRSALEQYTAVTAQDTKDAIPLLQRSQWNVQIAVSKFFDGEGPDPLAEALAAQDHIPQQASRHENLQESFDRISPPSSSRRANRTGDRPEPAPRIVPQPQTPTHRPPLLLALLFAPFNVGYRAVSALFRTFVYILSFLPAAIRPRALTASLSSMNSSGAWGIGLGAAGSATGRGNNAAASITGGGRRMLPPRDAAARFRREFEEEYGDVSSSSSSENNTAAAAARIPFFEGGFAQALDLAKKDLKFLLVILVSPEHDDTAPFTRETLLSDAVVGFLTDPNSNLLVWGGNVLDSEAYQVAAEYNCTKFPFSCLICLTPREHHSSTTSGSNSTRMSIVKRLAGPLPPSAYLAELQSAMTKYAPDLAAARAERTAHEVARSLRSEQDSAYERSLALDRERARQRREAEAAARDAERRARERAADAHRREQQRQQWRRWRATTVRPEPEPNAGGEVVRLALKMPERFEGLGAGGRVVRRFRADATVEELYAFVECFDLLQEREAARATAKTGGDVENEKGGEEEDGAAADDDDYEAPEGYEHEYKFRIASPLPRVVYGPDERGEDGKPATLRQRIGRSGNLIVEDLSDEDDDDDEDDEEEEEEGIDEKSGIAA